MDSTTSAIVTSASNTPSQQPRLTKAQIREQEILRRRLRFVQGLLKDPDMLFSLSGGKQVNVSDITEADIDKFAMAPISRRRA